MNAHILRIVFVFLLVIAAALGFLVYREKFPQREAVNPAAELSIPKTGNVLDISGCSPSPAELAVAQGAQVTLVNRDKEAHQVTFDKDVYYRVSGRSTYAFTVAVKHGSGKYGYGCDNSSKAAGFLVVSQP
jgi:plastocyanin